MKTFCCLSSNRWEALQMQVGGLWESIHSLRWAVAPPAYPHGGEKVCLSHVPQSLHAQRPPGQARPATPSSEEEALLDISGHPVGWPRHFHDTLEQTLCEASWWATKVKTVKVWNWMWGFVWLKLTMHRGVCVWFLHVTSWLRKLARHRTENEECEDFAV